MEKKENMAERERKGKKQRQEFKEDTIKLKRGMLVVAKRGGPSTPSPTWRLQFSSLDGNNSNYPVPEFLNTSNTVSARKLCANLWEIQPHLQIPLPEISKNRIARHGHHKKKKKEKAFELLSHLSDPPHQPTSASPSRRNVTQSSAQHQQSIESPASSLDFKGRTGEPSHSLKTSAELLKVLDRIWSLEETQSSNMSLLKSLKEKLKYSQSRIEELLKEKQSNWQEIDSLTKQPAVDRSAQKSKEQDRIKAVIQSARADLEDERKLRKHSESLLRKLARELSQVKSDLSKTMKELEMERKARSLLEKLCDEFAMGIRDYEQEVRSLGHKLGMDHFGREKPDCLILHISETWLDERMQTGQNDIAKKNSIVDKLSQDIENFLQARHSNGSRKSKSFLNEAINNWSCQESFPLNEAANAPQVVAGDRDSIDSIGKSAGKKQSMDKLKGRANHLFEEPMNLTPQKRMSSLDELQVRFNLIRNHSVSSEGDKIHPVSDLKEDSCVRPVIAEQESSVQQWMSKLASPKFEKSESLSQLPSGVKENTLKAKLLEARLESQKRAPDLKSFPCKRWEILERTVSS